MYYGTIGQNMGLPMLIMICVALLVGPNAVDSANILMVHPVVSRSHELMFITIGEALASRGHNVTLIRFKGYPKTPVKLIKVITLEVQAKGREVPYMNDDGVVEPPHDLLWSRARAPHTVPLDITVPVGIACETLISNDTIRMVKNTCDYDIAIVDLLFNECGLALVYELQLPVVAYWPTFPTAGETFWTSSFMSPSYYPAMMTEYTDRMTLVQRFINTAYYLGGVTFAYFIMLSSMHDVISKTLPNTPHPTQLIHNISMLLINSDFTLDFPRPITPNTIYIGCLQCRPTRPLPQDLEEFMQSSGDDGVIIFSLGATFNEEGMPTSVIKEIYNAFSRCKQKFLLKMSKISSVPLPANVHAVEWLPQQDILGHPKTRLFITHCGMHGVLEAIYHAVPMVGIPIFGDQGDVLVRLKLKGVAVGFDKTELTSDILYEAIQTVLNDQRYYINVKNLSAVLKDQPQTAMERGMYWIEYVIRHRGAEHLKTADRHLNIFQYLLLDVLLIFIIMMCTMLLFFKWLIRKLWQSLPFRNNNCKPAKANTKKKQR